MFGLGAPELVLILLVIVVVFGATKLPQLGDGLGRAIKNFKRAVGAGNEIEVAPKKPELGTEAQPGAGQADAKPDPK